MPSNTYTTPGVHNLATISGDTYVVESWGAGGGGKGGTLDNRNGAGGGGAYSKTTFIATGSTLTITVGAGGAAGFNAVGSDGGDSSVDAICVAKGGSGGTASAITGGSGGLASAGTGDVKYNGGNGGIGGGGSGAGGGGGSSAGIGLDGTNGESGDSISGTCGPDNLNPCGGTPPFGGGAGGQGGSDGGSLTTGTNGSAPGGGGGGGYNTGGDTGGAGGDGQVIVTWTSGSSTVLCSGQMPLYIAGPIPSSNAIPLYIASSFVNGNFPLYTNGDPIPSSGDITLYIGQQCFNTLYPNGDSGTTPSGHIVNSDNGSVTYYNYINSDPLSSVTDNSFINIVQSGHAIYPQNLYFSKYNIAGDAYNVLSVKISDSGVTTQVSSGVAHGKIAVDSVNSFLYFAQNNDMFRKRTDFSEDASLFVSNMNTVMTVKKICISYITNYVYVLALLNSNNQYYIYRYDFEGNYVDTIYSFPSTRTGISLRYNDSTNKLSTLYSTVIGATTFYYTKIITLNTAGGYTSDDSPVYISSTQLTDFDLKPKQDKLIFSSNTALIEYSGISTPSLISSLVTVDNNANIASIAIDDNNYRVYAGYFDTVKQSGVIRSYDANNGGTMLSFYTASGNYISDLALDKGVYKTTLDFTLTDPASTMTGNSENQLVSNAEVLVRGIENYNLTYINAKILTSDKQNVIWKTDGPYSASFSGTADGLKIGYIGTQNATIDQSFNSRGDWNGAILRLDISQPQNLQPSGNFKLYSTKVNIYCSGDYPDPISSTNNCTLYTYAKTSINSNFPLTITASGKASFVPLYTVASDNPNSGIPLFMYGFDNVNSGVPLYIAGIYAANASMNLHLEAIDPVRASGSVSFYMYSTTVPTTYRTTSLYMKSDEITGEPTTNMNLYLGGTGSLSITSYMNLYLRSEVPQFNNNMTLFMKNSTSGINDYTPLFMYGPQIGGSGWYPYSDRMNLYIARRSESYARNMSLTIAGPSGVTNNIPMFIQGSPKTSGIPLYIFGTDNPNSAISLYSHGF